MKAVVVYESHWGNTEAVARAIAAGIGPDAGAMTTDEASDAAVADADLIVAGSPLIAFGLPREQSLDGVRKAAGKAPTMPDVSHPTMRTWLGSLPAGHGAGAAFETRVRWSPGGATGAIEKGLAKAGYRPVATGQRYVVTGTYGPLRDGELERAREWGSDLAAAVGRRQAVAAE